MKNNPKELTIYFGGPRGKAIRQNYMSMIFENVAADGSVRSEKIFKEVDEDTTSYTYRSPTGLLSATQFTQPALTLMEKASFEDMRSKGLVQINSSFAGHSLGEYSALAALAEVMPIESLVSVVYYRGLTMQVAVERDATGRSNYSMCAVNPSRISKTFNEQALQYVVENISEETGWLLEIVNYNIANAQYVCAGDLRALDCLTNVTNYLKTQKVDIQALMQSMSLEDVKAHLVDIIRECAKTTSAKATPIDLQRGFATIPLKGIDVPFHSTFLRSGVKPFRNFLLKKIIKTTIDPSKLVGKYIPNVTAKPFELTKEYFEEVYRLTNSPRIGSVLANVSQSPLSPTSPASLSQHKKLTYQTVGALRGPQDRHCQSPSLNPSRHHHRRDKQPKCEVRSATPDSRRGNLNDCLPCASSNIASQRALSIVLYFSISP